MMRRFIWAGVLGIFFPLVLQGQTFTNVRLDDASVFPGTLIVAQIIEIKVTAGTLTISQITVKNTASDPKVTGGELEYIEIRRGSETGPVLKKKENNLSGFASGGGVLIGDMTNNSFPSGTHRLYILVKLKADAGLKDKRLSLGGTKIGVGSTSYDILYPPAAPAATFTVVGPDIAFEEGADDKVYRGQRFLAARISLDATNVPLDFTIGRLTIKNVAPIPALHGRYVARIEVRRAEDAALLGEQTTAGELEKFTTTGTPVPTTANNRVAAYSRVSVEIWITLKEDAPVAQKIQIEATVRCADTDFSTEGTAPTFTVQEESLGLEGVQSVILESKGVVPGQTFLAQHLKLQDNDADPYDVSLGSLLVRNVATAPLADRHISKIEVKRKSDGAVLSTATDLSGLSTTGVRIALTANNVIPDDTEVELDLFLTLADTAPVGRKIKLSSQVWYSEGGAAFNSGALEGPATFTVVGPAGLEKIENKTTAPADRNVYPGQSFLAQKIYLEDEDGDPHGITLTGVLVKNRSSSSPLQDQHVARIQIRDTAGKILGESTSISGLTTTGVLVNATAHNTIADDKSLTIEIWFTLRSDVPAGRKITAGARVQHSEGGQTFIKPDDFLTSGVEFTTARDGGRTVDFTYSPDKPTWSDEITFTPTVSPSTGIVYAYWDFGDGTVVERWATEGEKPLDPIKHKYGKGGNFTVVYAVRDEANREVIVSKRITVSNEPPKDVDFTFSPASPQVNQSVTFTPSDKITDPDGDIKKAGFRWDFGDGTAAATTTGPQNVTHAYAQAGTYTVTLTVTDQGGATSTARKEVRVEAPTPPPPQPPTVTNLTVTPANPEAGKPVTFTATANAPAEAPVTQWEWDFGDGSPLTTTETNTTTHTYANPGQYTVRVRVRNIAGWSQPFPRQITVYPPGVEFGALILDNPVTGNQCRIQIFAPAGATELKISIFDQAGRLVIRDKSVSVGTFTWDLRDQNGRLVPNGLYLFYITARVGGRTQQTEIYRLLVRR